VAAAAQVTDEYEFVVIGSQAILGCIGEPPDSMLRSQEVDIYPLHATERADMIDGALGDGSPFHATYGYHAHGVGPETAKAPRGWQERLVMTEVPPRPGLNRPTLAWCLEAHDLVLSKCAAGRERDWDYAADALTARLVRPEVLLSRVPDLPLDPAGREHITAVLSGIIASRSQRRP
jgi:hypothetical protein